MEKEAMALKNKDGIKGALGGSEGRLKCGHYTPNPPKRAKARNGLAHL